MKSIQKYLFLTGALAFTIPALRAEEAQSTENYNQKIMDRVMVIGSKNNIHSIAGSVDYLDKETLEKNKYADIHRILRQVPGVNIQEEEGFGNRPNIGIRGGRSERSADITLMEDGVLIAPAPYSSPSAYYFPRVNRMEAIEVRKGSSSIRSGPRTTSGVVNLVSSSVPEVEEFEGLFGIGSFGTVRSEVHYGNKIDNFGFVFDLGHESSDGFKSLDNGGDTGYSIQDVMAKFKVESDPSARFYQSIAFKVGATQEDSDETYLGLTNDDFRQDPFRRYAASSLDNIQSDHQNYMLRHFIDFKDFDITTTVYHNDFKRNWYKLQSATVGGVKLGISDALETSTHLAALRGEANLDGSGTDNLSLRANNRRYFSQGIQNNIATQFDIGNTKHALEINARFHRDEEDRYQWESQYAINNGALSLTNAGTAGDQANRTGKATAFATYIADDIQWKNITISPGIRYEHIQLKRDDRLNNQIRKNTVDAFVPGIGASIQLDPSMSVFAGVHRGFSPPSPSSTTDDIEESINYELGVRYNHHNLNTTLIGFANDYDNLIGECTISSSCSTGAVGDQFNAGAVRAYGLEASIGSDIAPFFGLSETSLPVHFNYTYTQAEFRSSFTSSFDEWGSVTSGDALPYIPEHQFFISAGVVQPEWEVHMGGKFTDKMRTVAGQGAIPAGEGTDSHFILDISGEVDIHRNTRLFMTIDNLLDKEYVAARRPAGARSGRPLTVLAGLKLSF